MNGLPAYRGAWNRTLAAHLLNRATFGPLPDEIDRAVAAGPEKTVDRLLSFVSEADKFPAPETPEVPDHPKLELAKLTPEERKKKVEEIRRANGDALEELRAWWIKRMMHSEYPLREKLTLFWHGHFTSSAEEVKSSRLMLRQNQFFRHNCLADFRTLLVGISRDPAMLRYLDNNTNRKQHPNENYARELLELFSMGIGNYTEDDVKAAARAFTGWTFEGEDFVFRRNEHDVDSKTFLHQTGNFDGEDIIDIVLQQPCTAEFMAAKFLKFFVADNPAPDIVEGAAELLRASRYEFKPMLRGILLSDYFYSPKVYRAQFKSPAQLIVGAVRTLGVTVSEKALAIGMRNLGQDLLYPPNVKGWDGGETWINTTTLLMRYNFAGYLLSGQMPDASTPPPKRPARRFRLERFAKPQNQLLEFYGIDVTSDAPKLVDAMLGRLLQAKLDPKARQWLVERAETTRISERPLTVAHLIMSMPEYQLC